MKIYDHAHAHTNHSEACTSEPWCFRLTRLSLGFLRLQTQQIGWQPLVSASEKLRSEIPKQTAHDTMLTRTHAWLHITLYVPNLQTQKPYTHTHTQTARDLEL